MSYIGPEPYEAFTSYATETFTTSSTTSYTLAHSVANENELALFINNVRQQPGSGKAYTASGTALTLSAATASTDTMYAIYLGRALQTSVPHTNSITSDMLASTFISGETALTSQPASTDELLLSDAGTLKRIDAQLIQNTPMFDAYAPGDQTITDNTNTKITFDTERFDSDGTYDHSSNYRFTPGIAGKYYIYAYVRAGHSNDASLGNNTISIYKNGSDYYTLANDHQDQQPKSETQAISAVIDSDDNDYFEIYAKYNMASVNATVYNGHFGAFKVTGA